MTIQGEVVLFQDYSCHLHSKGIWSVSLLADILKTKRLLADWNVSQEADAPHIPFPLDKRNCRARPSASLFQIFQNELTIRPARMSVIMVWAW